MTYYRITFVENTILYPKMARMHARVKGKSGSTRPVSKDVSFVKAKPKDIIELILKMAKEDIKPSVIGLVLRDTHGIPSVKLVVGKTINQILADNKASLSIPEDLAALVVRAKGLRKHIEKNKRDTHNKRGLILIDSKIRRLTKYYVNKKKLPVGWTYN